MGFESRSVSMSPNSVSLKACGFLDVVLPAAWPGSRGPSYSGRLRLPDQRCCLLYCFDYGLTEVLYTQHQMELLYREAWHF